MNNLSRLLQNIKDNPATYLDKPSLTCLHSFLNSYLSTFCDLGFIQECLAMEGFGDWMQERVETTVPRSWDAIFLFTHGSERNAFYSFFELFEEFLKHKESYQNQKDEAEENLKSNMKNWKSGTYNFYKLLKDIKKRPAMYLGTTSITRLDMALRGYKVARTEVGLAATEEEIQFEGFQKWVQEKYEIKSNQSWAKIILFFSMDEHEALERFFELFEEYQNRNKSSEVEKNSD
ncbi:hypothetical protein OGM63_02295 [Plectonema radiosum NIES-515]|uniref:Uncharacterized protein n=1 Tax=Plectonema radiosum NIES-515 TaxID=2986073 RepID=A0ABT3AUF8_9CYAN|nr:hypothetical protein [Plectonema radiosum]MCV3212370.1 hypothetical protein [Plectonema radiosum NIES-515]